MRQQNSIAYGAIKLTIMELNKVGETELANKLEKTLLNDELPKPEKHNRKDDHSTSYYAVTLNEEGLEKIVDLFLDLEVASLDENYETTTSTYSDMVSIWSAIKPT